MLVYILQRRLLQFFGKRSPIHCTVQIWVSQTTTYSQDLRSCSGRFVSVTRKIQWLDKKQLLHGIERLPERWRMCISHEGDYIEGLWCNFSFKIISSFLWVTVQDFLDNPGIMQLWQDKKRLVWNVPCLAMKKAYFYKNCWTFQCSRHLGKYIWFIENFFISAAYELKSKSWIYPSKTAITSLFLENFYHSSHFLR